MSEKICTCGHSENEHEPLNGEYACFHKNPDGSFTNYCECMCFVEDANLTWQRDMKLIEANYDALQTPMSCGHLARYAANEEDGTQYCVMCVLEATQLTIMNLINEDDDE